MSNTANGHVKPNFPERLKELDAFFNQTIKARLFKDYANEPDSLKNIIERFSFMVDWNVPHGKKLRGLSAYQSVMILLDIDLEQTDNKNNHHLIEQSLAISWAIEFLQAAFLVADDIMDNSLTRRGQQCWYLKDHTGSMAINDSFYLIALVYKTIQEFANDHPMYNKLYEVFTMALNNTVIGQGLDLITPPKERINDKFNFTNYTIEQYYAIVKWKTAYYSFCLPIQTALYLASISDQEIHEKCRSILLDMGVFFQVQDDYIDCYGDPSVTGKIGTDIEESKCSWLVTQALQKCTPEQRLFLEENYGKNDPDSVLKVKKLFNDLSMKDEYEKYESIQFEKIMSGINDLKFNNQESVRHTEKVKSVLQGYAKLIFKRKK